jgi:Ca-activated chloride channel family protein
MKRLKILWLASLLSTLAMAQETIKFSPKVHRILFLLDASGSMKEKWNNKTRFDAAKEILIQLIDSIEQKNTNIEFGIRTFGHQFPRENKNCNDTKLLVPFSKNNAATIKQKLSEIDPKGMTPISYAISQCSKDFPQDETALNGIILITDGGENCNGNFCEAAKALIEKRITVKPFVVGLDITQKVALSFSCIGNVMNTTNEKDFQNTVGIMIKQTLNNTTAQINFLDQRSQPTVTNIPFSLIDHFSGKTLYNFIHKQNSQREPDTLFLNPTGVYDLLVHTSPPIRKNNIELTVGKHNVIAVDVPLSTITFSGNLPEDARGIITLKNNSIFLQNINASKQYVDNNYAASATTLPISLFSNISITNNPKLEFKIEAFGTLSLNVTEPMVATIVSQKNEEKKVAGFELSTNKQLKLQPGKYLIIYKPIKSNRTESTKSLWVNVESGKYQSVVLK